MEPQPEPGTHLLVEAVATNLATTFLLWPSLAPAAILVGWLLYLRGDRRMPQFLRCAGRAGTALFLISAVMDLSLNHGRLAWMSGQIEAALALFCWFAGVSGGAWAAQREQARMLPGVTEQHCRGEGRNGGPTCST